MLDKLTRALLRHARGRELGDLGGVLPQRALWLLLRRGVLPLLRGTARRAFLRNVEGPLFIGRGVRILSGSLLSVGRGVFIGDYSYINCYSVRGVKLGHHVTIREFGWLQLTSRLDAPGDTIEIGDNTYIGPRVTLGAAAPLRIGNDCQIGANVSFIAESHRFEGTEEINMQGVNRRGITIGDDCWIGNNAIILDGVEVGTGTVIGAGTVVTKSLPPRSVAVGVPARVIRSR
jgi:acetyltransferase-like isoleucine patch superfamily enzyme